MAYLRHHCDIWNDEEIWYYEDAESNPGVYVHLRGNPTFAENEGAV